MNSARSCSPGWLSILAVFCAVLGQFGLGNVTAQIVDTPTFMPDAADGQIPFKVTVTCATSGATVRYTTNGVDPTEFSVPVPMDGKVLIAANVTLKARAYKVGMTPSAVKSATYRVTGAITGGGAHVLALTPGGNLYAWGPQSSGRLGNGSGSSTDALTPSTVVSPGGPLTGVVDMSGGYIFSLAVTADGKVWAAGDNANGQLGTNSVTDFWIMQRVLKNAVVYSSAVETDFLSGIIGVSGGCDFSTAVASDGKVWSWGQRARGRLADGYVGTTASQRRYAGTVKIPGNVDLANAVQVRSGRGHSVALTDLDSQGRGQLWAWGRNVEGQLGQGNTTDSGYALRVKRDATATTYPTGNWMDKVIDFAVGYDHVVAIRQDDAGVRTVWCWGEQQNGRLGNGLTTSAVKSYPVQVEKSAGVYLTDIIQVAAAGRFTLALDSSGKVWSWGYNVDGQLGDGTTTQRAYAQPVKTSAGVDLTGVVFVGAGGHDVASPFPCFALAITSTGTFYGWGQNDRGQTGGGTTTPGNRTYATQTTFTTKFNNLTPSVSLSMSPSTAVEPASFNLSATASDTDGTIAKVEFYENGVLLGEDTGSPFTWSVTNRTEGSYTYTAVATDNQGATAEHSQAVTVTLPPVQTPTANPPGNTLVNIEQIMINSTPGAKIYYEFGGTTPTTSSNWIYANTMLRIPPANALANRTLKFFAAKDGMIASLVQTEVYSGISQVDAGSATFYLDPNGRVWSCGLGWHGALGLGHSFSRSTLTMISSLSSVRAISAGSQFALALKSDGTVWSWGRNHQFQLGDGTATPRSTPVQVLNLTNVIAISAGSNHSLALKSDGTVWAWGAMSPGGPVPVQISISQVTAISAGPSHALVLKSDGTVWAWGSGSYGALGNGSWDWQATPVQAIGVSDAIAINASSSSTAIRKDGSLLSWGSNYNWEATGQSGPDTNIPGSVSGVANALAIGTNSGHGMVINFDGTVTCWGSNGSGQCATAIANRVTATQVPLVSSARTVTGSNTSLTLTSNGVLWSWGYGAEGQLGYPVSYYSITPSQVPVSTDSDLDGLSDAWELLYFPSLLARDGSIDSDGDDLTDGQEYLFGTIPTAPDSDSDGFTDAQEIATGNDPALATDQPQRVSVEVTSQPSEDGTTPVSGNLKFKRTGTLTGDWSLFFRAYYTVTGTAQPGTAQDAPTGADYPTLSGVVSFPINSTEVNVPVAPFLDVRPEGDETIIVTLVAVAPGTPNALPYYLDAAKTVATLTITDAPPVGNPSFYPTPGGTVAAEVVQIRGDAQSTVHYTTNGAAPTTSSPSVPANSLVRVPTGATLKAIAVQAGHTPSGSIAEGTWPGTMRIAAGQHHSLFRSADNKFWAWGRNGDGQLGTTFSPTHSPIEIGSGNTYHNFDGGGSNGGSHSVAVNAAGTVLTWGSNSHSQLGVTGIVSRSTIGTATGFTGTASAASAGGFHTVVLKDDGTVWSFGANSDGQLGNGTTSSPSATAVQATGLTGIVSVAAGRNHSVALHGTGTVYSWGDNSVDQMGNPSVSGDQSTPVQVPGLTDIVAICAHENVSLALRRDGLVFGWGLNSPNQQARGASGTNPKPPVAITGVSDAIAISMGSVHAAALRTDGSIVTWGANTDGATGNPSGTSVYPATTMGGVSNVLAIATGRHSLALTESGEVWSWGANDYGQLGLGTTGLGINKPQPITAFTKDTDNDGLLDSLEVAIGSSVTDADSNDDGISDGDAYRLSGYVGDIDANNDGVLDSGVFTLDYSFITNLDLDGDGVTNAQELFNGTSPFSADTDADGVADNTDVFPLDPTQSTTPTGQTTGPVITITFPAAGITLVP